MSKLSQINKFDLTSNMAYIHKVMNLTCSHAHFAQTEKQQHFKETLFPEDLTQQCLVPTLQTTVTGDATLDNFVLINSSYCFAYRPWLM